MKHLLFTVAGAVAGYYAGGAFFPTAATATPKYVGAAAGAYVGWWIARKF